MFILFNLLVLSFCCCCCCCALVLATDEREENGTRDKELAGGGGEIKESGEMEKVGATRANGVESNDLLVRRFGTSVSEEED